MCAFHGQMGMFVRALAYMLSHGRDGLRQASGDAVLSANYVLASLKDVISAPYEGPCMHEALFDDEFLKGTGVTTLDIAKRLIDEGFHPMTVYFPLTVTARCWSSRRKANRKRTLDRFIARDARARRGSQSRKCGRFQTGAGICAPAQTR